MDALNYIIIIFVAQFIKKKKKQLLIANVLCS